MRVADIYSALLMSQSCANCFYGYSYGTLNSPTPVHFSSLIPKMVMLTLAISCLSTSNLPWFMDLTFQVPMQYCSLQHWTLLPSPVTSTTGCCFCFGSVSSFFLKLFLHWSSVAYWAPTDLESSSFSVLFHTVHGVLKARILKWFVISFSSGPHFAITLHHDPHTAWLIALSNSIDMIGLKSL